MLCWVSVVACAKLRTSTLNSFFLRFLVSIFTHGNHDGNSCRMQHAVKAEIPTRTGLEVRNSSFSNCAVPLNNFAASSDHTDRHTTHTTSP